MKHFLISLLLLLAITLPAHSQQYRVPTPNVLRSLRVVDVKDFLARSTSITEWRHNVERIKAANGGRLPSYFQREVVDSGWAYDLRDSWDSSLRGDGKL